MSPRRIDDTFNHTETDLTDDKVGDTARAWAAHGFTYLSVRPKGQRTWTTVRLPPAQARVLCQRGVEISDVAPSTAWSA